MSAEPHPVRRLLFGPFTFDETTGDLAKFGVSIRLHGQPLQILSMLVARPGELVTRDEMQQELWKGTTFVDFDRGLNAAVNKLRQALGDSADQPRYIETVTGKGYRFIAPLQNPSLRPVAEIARPAARPPSKSRLRLFVLPLVAFAIAGLSYWVGKRNLAPVLGPEVRFTITPPAGFELEGASSRQSFAVSPDGLKLAFTAMDTGGAFHLFVRDWNQVEARQLPNTAGVHAVFWAPDSKHLFYTAKGQLFRSPLEGEARQAISTSPAFFFMGDMAGPSKMILSARNESFMVSTHGGAPESIGAAYWWGQLLPDGKNILYVRLQEERAGRFQVRVADLANPKAAKTVAESDSRALFTRSVRDPALGYLLYIRRGTLLAHPFVPGALATNGEPIAVAGGVYSFFPTGAADFSVSRQGVLAYQSVRARSRLVWVDRAGRVLSGVGPEAASVKSGRLSPDGKTIAAAFYDVDRGSQNLWLWDLASGAGRLLDARPGLREAAVWEPGSQRLAYLHSVVSRPRVTVRGLGVEQEEKVLSPDDTFQMPTSWSPDARHLAFTNTGFVRFPNEVNSDIFVIDTKRSGAVTAIANSPFHESLGAFSPDGRWMAFTSNESGQTEVYLQAFEGGDTPRLTGPRHLVSRRGAQALRWRADGKEIFYLGIDGKVHAVPVRLSATPSLGKEEALFEISVGARAAIHSLIGFDVTPDGQRFLIPVITGGERPSLIVIQNWEALLKN